MFTAETKGGINRQNNEWETEFHTTDCNCSKTMQGYIFFLTAVQLENCLLGIYGKRSVMDLKLSDEEPKRIDCNNSNPSSFPQSSLFRIYFFICCIFTRVINLNSTLPSLPLPLYSKSLQCSTCFFNVV